MRPRLTQKVLIVNGSGDVLEMLEPVLDAGNTMWCSWKPVLMRIPKSRGCSPIW
ncbi:MAG: hypothetical protein QM736_21250 [Vicinamibacterales bacterium]